MLTKIIYLYVTLLCSIIFFLLSCTQTKTDLKQSTESIGNNIVTDQIPVTNIPSEDYLIIGGYKTNYLLTHIDNDEWELTSYSVDIGDDYSVNFSGIERIPYARFLDIWLHDTHKVDFSPIRSISDILTIKLGGRGLTTIPDLGGIPSLEYLQLHRGRLTNLNGIEKITSLEYLSISGNRERIMDISALRTHNKLKEITFHNGSYNIDFSVLKDLTKLEELAISGCGEVDLNGISQLRSLTKLILISNIMKENEERSVYLNYEEIGRMSNLTALYLDESITSVVFLSNNTNLERLELIADQERSDYSSVLLPLDVSPLRNLTHLTYLAIRGFELQNAEVLKSLPNLSFFSTNSYGSSD